MTNSHSDQAPGQNKTTMIVVNGRQREVSGKEISYTAVVKLAFPDDQENEAIEYKVA